VKKELVTFSNLVMVLAFLVMIQPSRAQELSNPLVDNYRILYDSWTFPIIEPVK
jgi:hypothetical protein